MRRPTAITLVLMGGAVLTLGACEGREAKCQRARLEGRADAEAICAARGGGGGGGGGGGSWWSWSGRSGSTATTGTSTSSARGGFGGTAASAGG